MTSASLKSNDQRPPTEAAEGSPATADRPDFLELLGGLSDAISVITIVHRSLEAKEIAEVGDEEVALRHGLALLRAAYSALDMASLRLG
jgi:hypothetical protein